MSLEPTVLRTARLVLRPPRPEDRESLAAIYRNEEVAYFLLPGPRAEVESQTAPAPRPQSAWDDRPTFVIEFQDEVVGEVVLEIDHKNRTANLGYAVAREHWGWGLATEAARAVVAYGFQAVGLAKIHARADPRNVRSVRVLQKLGTHWEGHFRSHLIRRGERVNRVYYGLLRDEWEQEESPSAPALLETRREIARQIAARLPGHPGVSAVLVFGSVASGHVNANSDVDLLVICRSSVIALADRQRILGAIGSDWVFSDRSDDNRLFADRDSDGVVNGVRVTVHYQTVPWIAEVLAEVLGHGAITTETLPFRPYTLPALLQRAWLLRDEDGVVSRWREEAQVFPPALKANLLRHFAPILQEHLAELKATAERDLGPRGFLFHLDRAVDALGSLLFALNEIYDPADRRAERTIIPSLRRLPKDFLPILTEVLRGPFDRDGARWRARLFEQLATRVLRMVEESEVR